MNSAVFKICSTVLVLSIFYASCSREPHVIIAADKSIANVGEVVSFENYSLNAYDFRWDFGDGTWSLAEEPTHIYEKAGTYTVKLFAYSKRGNEFSSNSIPIRIVNSDYEDILESYTENQQKILGELIGRWRIFYASEVVTDCQTSHVDSLYSRISENILYTLEFFLDGSVIIIDDNGINRLEEWQLIGDSYIVIPEIILSGSLISNPLTGLELGGLYEFSVESGTFLSSQDQLRENPKPQVNCDDKVFQVLRMESTLLNP